MKIHIRIDTEAMKVVFSRTDVPLNNFHILLNGLLGSAGNWRAVDPADIYFLPHIRDEGRTLSQVGPVVSVAMAIQGQWVATLYPASPDAMKTVLDDGNRFKWPVKETDYVPVHMKRVEQSFQKRNPSPEA